MLKAGFVVARAWFLVLAVSMLGVGVLAGPAAASKSTCASSAGKCFAVTVSSSPAGPPAGGTVSFAFTVTNEAQTQQIGSFKITAPAVFVVTGASAPSSTTSSSATFTNLSLAPSRSITVTVTALLPCSGGPYQWGMEVKQSNDFSGLPGNDFQPDPANAGNLSGAPSGSCSLAFTSDGQPAGTAIGAKIAAGFGSQGGPVKVGLLDASGRPITNQAAIGSVAVTVALGANPGSGTLKGTTTENTSGGIASFSDLNIGQQSNAYTLTASTKSPGFNPNPTPSAFFTIFGSLKGCGAPPCNATLSSSTTTGTVTATSVPSTSTEPLLGSTLGGASYSCGTYQAFSDPFSFDVFSNAGAFDQGAQFTASLDFSKSLVKSSGRTSAASWQLCYASTQPFTTVAGPPSTDGTTTIGGVIYYTGLLPDCSSTQGAPPCVVTRQKGGGGDVTVTFTAKGDPFGRG